MGEILDDSGVDPWDYDLDYLMDDFSVSDNHPITFQVVKDGWCCGIGDMIRQKANSPKGAFIEAVIFWKQRYEVKKNA